MEASENAEQSPNVDTWVGDQLRRTTRVAKRTSVAIQFDLDTTLARMKKENSAVRRTGKVAEQAVIENRTPFELEKCHEDLRKAVNEIENTWKRYESLLIEANLEVKDEHSYYEEALIIYRDVAKKLHDVMKEITSQSSQRSKSSRHSRRSNQSTSSQDELAKRMSEVALQELNYQALEQDEELIRESFELEQRKRRRKAEKTLQAARVRATIYQQVIASPDIDPERDFTLDHLTQIISRDMIFKKEKDDQNIQPAVSVSVSSSEGVMQRNTSHSTGAINTSASFVTPFAQGQPVQSLTTKVSLGSDLQNYDQVFTPSKNMYPLVPGRNYPLGTYNEVDNELVSKRNYQDQSWNMDSFEQTCEKSVPYLPDHNLPLERDSPLSNNQVKKVQFDLKEPHILQPERKYPLVNYSEKRNYSEINAPGFQSERNYPLSNYSENHFQQLEHKYPTSDAHKGLLLDLESNQSPLSDFSTKAQMESVESSQSSFNLQERNYPLSDKLNVQSQRDSFQSFQSPISQERNYPLSNKSNGKAHHEMRDKYIPSDHKDLSILAPEFVPWAEKNECANKDGKVDGLIQCFGQIYNQQSDFSRKLCEFSDRICDIQEKQMIATQRASLAKAEPPTFNSEVLAYPAWEAAFNALIDQVGITEQEKLFLLSKYTSGKARNMIQTYVSMGTPVAYEEARKLLKERFGNPVVLYESFRDRLESWPKISKGKDIQEFYDFVQEMINAMRSIEYLRVFDNVTTIKLMVGKLPPYTFSEWQKSCETLEGGHLSVNLGTFVHFLRKVARRATDPIFGREALLPENQKARSTTKKADSFAAVDDSKSTSDTKGSTSNPITCLFCEKAHSIAECPSLLEKSPKECQELIFKRKLCFKCGKLYHQSKDCRYPKKCAKCQGQHMTILHDDDKVKQEQENKDKKSEEAISLSALEEEACIAISPIVPIYMFSSKSPNRIVKTFALIDSGANVSFVTSEVCEKLGMSTHKTTLNLSTVHGTHTETVEVCEGLECKGIKEDERVILPKLYVRECLPVAIQVNPKGKINELRYLDQVRDKMHFMSPGDSIGVILGTNCPRGVYIIDLLHGPPNYPQAVKYVLGWALQGTMPGSCCTAQNDEVSMSHRVVAEVSAARTNIRKEFVYPLKGKEVINPCDITHMFQQEYSECYCGESYSVEDKQFLEIMESSLKVDGNGHFEIALPVRDRTFQLPFNRGYAYKRLMTLKKKLAKDPDYHSKYNAFMNEMLESGHCEPVSPGTTSDGSTWYIPHFGVTNENKPDKIRIVFDCAAKFQGICLNDILLSGPDLTNSLIGVLMRFRVHLVAFTADIKGMFLQVRVNEDDRNYLRFLWWEGGDIGTEPHEYRMCVHLFGATSSPSCASFALKKATECIPKGLHNPERAIKAVKTSMYVDDLCEGSSTVEDALHLIQDTKAICNNRGFELVKFKSSNPELMALIPEEERGLEEICIIDDRKDFPLERALGVHWCIQSDKFKFRIILQDKPLTRRGILSTISSIFDPLGFCAPVTLKGKRILQKICSQSKDVLGWDEPILETELMDWIKWRQDILKLDSLEIERCYVPKEFQIEKAELHHFGDAAPELGLGQCSYVRLISTEGSVHCCFVFGKSKVPPLKFVTVPRLELNAAVLAVRAANLLNKELRTSFANVGLLNYFWSDSKVVLGYIKNDTRRFKTYVANRIEEIRESSGGEQWKYVASNDNPADQASRGLTVEELVDSKYLIGPSFLWETDLVEHSPYDSIEEVTNDPEVKESFAVVSQTTSIMDRLEKFSNWYRLLRVVAIILKWKKRKGDKPNDVCLDMKHGRNEPPPKIERNYPPSQLDNVMVPLLSEELKYAELVVYKLIQQTYLTNEIKLLMQGKNCGNQKLYKLDPFIDDEGLMRVGGRIRNAVQPFSLKHPIVLPPCKLVECVVTSFHSAVKHQGRGITSNEIRQNGIWILGGNRFIAKIVAACVTCRRYRGSTNTQKMADLPEDRLSEAPCFSFVGCDFFGPFLIKERRSELKRYGCLFTCLTSRAVHIEVAPSLETDDFLNCLRRFICRRGPVSQIRCDRGTNFVGCSNELKRCLDEMDSQHIGKELLKLRCDWVDFKFNTPCSSHMGGVWERMIRSIRSVLNILLASNSTILDADGLYTLMCEVEAIINSRPLTTMDGDNIVEPLTPSHLLTMKTKVVLSPPGTFLPVEKYSRRRWKRIQVLADQFWTRFRQEYLCRLQERHKWQKLDTNIKIGDVVLVKSENTPRNNWPLGRVEETYTGTDGLVRKVRLLMASSSAKRNGVNSAERVFLERPIHKLVLLLED